MKVASCLIAGLIALIATSETIARPSSLIARTSPPSGWRRNRRGERIPELQQSSSSSSSEGGDAARALGAFTLPSTSPPSMPSSPRGLPPTRCASVHSSEFNIHTPSGSPTPNVSPEAPPRTAVAERKGRLKKLVDSLKKKWKGKKKTGTSGVRLPSSSLT